MICKKTPSRLKKAPIIDSIFEIRYKSAKKVSTIIPGILHGALQGQINILPVPPIPLEIIESDPNMQTVPTFMIEWNKFTISGNHQFLAVSYAPPYERWVNFKEGITQVHKALFDINIFSEINRYSIKYVDFIEKNESIAPMDLLDIDITLQQKQMKTQNLMLQVELPEDSYVNIVKILTLATIEQAANNQLPRTGLIIDTDTICSFDNFQSPDHFIQNHDRLLDEIHKENKNLFFKTLSAKGIEYLEPEYE